MKILNYILLLILLAGCSNRLDFEFYDAMERQYTVKTLEASFKQHYGHSYRPFVVLVETAEINNDRYRKQLGVLEKLDTEKINAIYVIACQSVAEKSGYHVKPDLAKKMMPKGEFRIRVISPKGLLLKESQQDMSAEEIELLISTK